MSIRLTEHVHVVGSGRLGLGITHPLDCHVYVIDGGSEAALVDSGVGIESERLLHEIVAAGIDPERVTTVLLTHAHPDHAGGVAWLAEQLGARIVAAAPTASALHAGDDRATGLEFGKRAGIYPAELVVRASGIDVVDHGDRIPVGSVTVEVVATPGHSDGHLSFLLHRRDGSDLFTGDAMLFGGQIILQPTEDCVWTAQLDSLRRLAALRHDGLFPGHLGWALHGGDAHARRAVEQLDATGRPPIFVG